MPPRSALSQAVPLPAGCCGVLMVALLLLVLAAVRPPRPSAQSVDAVHHIATFVIYPFIAPAVIPRMKYLFVNR